MALPCGVFNSHRSANFEGHFAGVDFMVGAVDNCDFGVDEVVAGKNARGEPFFDPFDARLMYSLGITPPTILLTISLPFPFSFGSSSKQTWAYCPRPPVCLTYFIFDFPGLEMVSL